MQITEERNKMSSKKTLAVVKMEMMKLDYEFLSLFDSESGNFDFEGFE